MKTTALITAGTALLMVACGPSEAEIAAKKAQQEADSLAAVAASERTYTIDAAGSKVVWTGTMLGIKSHHGVVGVSGSFTAKANTLTGGEFTVDLNTIAPEDTLYAPDGSKQGTKAMLIGHLKSGDFFDVATFPTATFKITGVEGNTATGDFTVRGTTHTENVTDIVLTTENGVAKATGKLVFDRQKYGVAWSSGSQDAVLNDNIELAIELTANAQ